MSAPSAGSRTRIVVRDEGDRLVLRFERPRAPRVMLGAFLAFWAVGWAGAGGGVVALFAAAEVEPRAATLAGMGAVVWLGGVAFALWALFRGVLATQEVAVGRSTLTIRHVAGPLHPGTSYDLARVRDLQIEGGGTRRAAFAFVHAGRRVRFGLGIAGEEAEGALAALRARLPALSPVEGAVPVPHGDPPKN